MWKIVWKKDNIQRHVEQHHNQYGGEAKGPASSDESEEPIHQKRYTAESNTEDTEEFHFLYISKSW